jgi:hypothetical protein
VARGGSPSRAATRQEASNDGGAGVVGLALRFALTAPPFGLRRATLRARPTTKKRSKNEKQKGDTSNEVRKGTFLKRFDTWRVEIDTKVRLAYGSAQGSDGNHRRVLI